MHEPTFRVRLDGDNMRITTVCTVHGGDPLVVPLAHLGALAATLVGVCNSLGVEPPTVTVVPIEPAGDGPDTADPST